MSNQIKTITLEAPEEIFDVEGATIERRKRIPLWRVDAMRTAQSSEEVYEQMAAIFPAWNGIVDVETGEPLPNPEDDPSVFGRLDKMEQMPWLGVQIGTQPDPNASRSRKGRK